jgi:glycosyltransferase involved in cell wall biosynthesis
MSYDIKSAKSPCFTIFTPTYNRAHTLPRVYKSINSQTFRDFEWVIVDDGSSDNTAALISEWQRVSDFDIFYIYQDNSHKKTAFNRGVRAARGAYFLCWDSDDTAPSDALSIFLEYWLQIPENEQSKFVGVTGLCINEAGEIVGDKFPSSPYDSNTLATTFGIGIRGEKWGFQRTAILKDYPFPDFIKGLVGESLVWNAIARKYRTRYINRVVRTYHMEVDSLIHSQKTLKKMRIIAEGQCYAASNFLDNDWQWIFRSPMKVCKIAANHTRFALHLSQTDRGHLTYPPKSLPGKILQMLGWPVGFLVYKVDQLRCPEC